MYGYLPTSDGFCMVNVGKFTSPMDPMGFLNAQLFEMRAIFSKGFQSPAAIFGGVFFIVQKSPSQIEWDRIPTDP